MPSAPHDLAPQSLPELLRIMDVATALRREREKAAAHLDFDEVKATLQQRLRATADEMGDPVTDAEIDAAIARYFAQLYQFREPPPSLQRTLAHLYVRRGKIAAGALVVLVLWLLVWWLFFAAAGPWSPAARRARVAERQATLEADAQRRLDVVWKRFTDLLGTVLALAREDGARTEAQALRAEAEAARATGSAAAVEAVRSRLETLHGALAEAYEVRVVSRPNERSGVDAYYEDDAGRRLSGYYLVVEAVTPDGKVLTRRVRDSETDQVVQVRKWGEQVPQSVYDRIAADKRGDGVVDENLFARKLRGHLDEEVVMRGGAGNGPLQRGRRITKDL